MLYLTMEDIIPNSIIELEKIDGSTSVLISDAIDYGKEVAAHLKRRGYYTSLKLKEDLFDASYCDYFDKYYEKQTYGYRLASGKTVRDIVSIFRDSLDDEVIESFTSSEVIANSFLKKRSFVKTLKKIK